jgi:spermidine synthase
METWFSEEQADGLRLGFRVQQLLVSQQTAYQSLQVMDTDAYGRLWASDDAVQAASGDEFVYHEMITHVPLFMRAHPRRVADIGGGDGGALREVLKHLSVQEAHMVDIDPVVVQATRRYLPALANALDDPRVRLHLADGLQWIVHARRLDVVIVHFTEPVGISRPLLCTDFYRQVKNALTPDGVMVTQSESPFLHAATIRQRVLALRHLFKYVQLYLAPVPTYPSGLWSFLIASDQPLTPHPRCQTAPFPTRYWTPAIQTAAFVLPRFVHALVAP